MSYKEKTMKVNSQKYYAAVQPLHTMELIDCEILCVCNNNHIANVLGIQHDREISSFKFNFYVFMFM